MTTPRSIRERSVFVDSSAFYAFLDRADRWHTEAQATFKRLASERRPLYTSNLVIAETHVLSMRALGRAAALRWLDTLSMNLLFETEADHERAHALLSRRADRDFSYADATSFVLMERLDISLAFTFDAHFRQYGVQVVP